MTIGASHGPGYPQIIVEALTRYPARDAFVDGDRRMSYREAASLIGRMQTVLQDAGIGPGSALVALSPNIPEAFLIQVAAWMNGARYTGLHPLGSVEDHVALCEDAEARVLVAHPSYAEASAAVTAKSSSITTVLSFGPSEFGRDLIAEAAAAPERRLLAPAPRDDEPVWVLYTGGTTGRSKGVVHGHRSMVDAVQGITTAWELPLVPRYLACGPITHASVLPIVPTLVRGGTVIFNRGFDPDRWLHTVEREQVNFAFVVPTMVYSLLDRGDPSRRDLTSLDTILYGSAPMSPQRLTEALEVFGPRLVQAYGQSETLGLATALRRDEHCPNRLASCGRPVVGAHLELLGENSEPVPDGAIGEVCLRARFTMDRYWHQPELTDEVLRGGWLHTGDLARRDDEGFLYIVDRTKDMIISGAFNVYPREIEDVLTTDPSVAAAAVIGAPDPKWGEAVTAFIVAKPGHSVDADHLTSLVRSRKGPHQAPKAVHLIDALPLTSVGKIDKKALRAQFYT